MLILPMVFIALAVVLCKTSACGGFYNATTRLQEIQKYANDSTSCDWIIRATNPGKSVYLHFVNHSQTWGSSIQVYDGIYNIASFPVQTSGNDVKIVVNNGTAMVKHVGPRRPSWRSKGISFRLQYMEVNPCGSTLLLSGSFSTPNFPSFAPPSTKCGWNLLVDKQQLQQSYLLHLFLHNVEFSEKSDLVEIYNPSERMRTVTGNSSLYHKYFLRVYMETGPKKTTAMKFSANFNYTTCNRDLTATDSEHILQTPGYPSHDVGSLLCTWTIRPLSSNKSIKVQVLETNSTRGIFDILLINSSHPNINHRIFTTLGGRRNKNVYDPFNLIVHSPSLQVRATGIMGGFRLTYSQVTKCGFDTNVLNGKLNSTNFPQNVPPNTQCAWNIYSTTAAVKEKVFQMIFGTVQHSSDPSAVLQVYDMHGFLADLYKDTYRDFATENVLRVYYNSGTTTGNPFKATYRYNVCHKTLTATPIPQTITTPGFPFFRPTRFTCNLTINTSGPLKSVQLKISGNPNNTRCCSSTTVFEGPSQIGFYQGISQTIQLVAHKFPVKVDHASKKGSRGYSIVYREVPICGFSTNKTNGSISSPKYPQKAGPNLVCGWTLYHPSPWMNQLRTLVISNVLEIDLYHDIFEVYAGDLIHRLLNNTPNYNQLFTSRRTLRVYFETANRPLSNTRLYGDYNMKVCGGTFRAKVSEQFLSPFGIPGVLHVPPIRNCKWTITAEPSNTIYIKLLRMPNPNNVYISFSIYGLANLREVNDKIFVVRSQTTTVSFLGPTVTFAYSQVQTCGREIHSFDGEFSSEEIPSSNQSRIVCSWDLSKYSNSPYALTLNVANTSFPTTAIKVYTSGIGKWVDVIAGQRAIFYDYKPIQVYLELNNKITNGIDFYASYTTACSRRLNFTEAKRYFSDVSNSLLYYQSTHTCVYTIVSPGNQNSSVYIKVYDLYLDQNTTNAIEMAEGGVRIKVPLGKERDVNIVSNSPSVTIVPTLQRKNALLPFLIDIEEVPTCGTTERMTTGSIISSPGFPSFAPRGLRCGWTLTGSGSFLALKMLSLTLSPMDKLEIYTLTNQFYNTSQFLSSTLPFTNTMRIYFETNTQQSRFSVNISRQFVDLRNCGEKLIALPEWQEISSRGYPYVHLHNLDCSWRINKTTPKKMVHFKVDLEIIDSHSWLQISQSDGLQLSRLQGNLKGVEIFSETDVTVSFVTQRKARGGFLLRYREGNPNVCINSTCHKTLARCTPLPDNSAYTCSCLLGYEGDGTTCNRISNVCTNSTCHKTLASCTPRQNNSAYSCACAVGYKGDGTICNPFCNETVLYDNVTNTWYNFGRGNIGESVLSKQKCRNGRSIASAVCLRSQLNQDIASFAKLQSLPCATNLSTVVAHIFKKPTTTKAITSSLTILRLVTSSTNTNLSAEETATVTNTLLQLSTVASKLKITRQNLLDTVLITNQVSASLANRGETTKKLKEQKKTLIKVLQDFTDQVQLPGNSTSLNLRTRDITIQIKEQKPTGDHYSDVSFSPVQTSGIRYEPPISFTIPAELLEIAATSSGETQGRIKRNLSEKPVRVSFVLHKNSTLFPTVEDEISEVITARIKGFTVSNSKELVKITFNNRTKRQGGIRHESNPLKETLTRTQCVSLDKKRFRWVPNACVLVSGQDGDPRFHCHKLGHFAMIVKSVVLPSAHALHIATYIGCGLSMVGLVLTFVIYISVTTLRARKPTLFLLNICVCLLVVNAIFLTSAGNVENRIACYISTAFLQYFLLAAWFWMSANAYDLYNALVKVMSTSSDKVRITSIVVSYLVPLIIVLVNACVTILYYDIPRYRPDDNLFVSSYQARHMCWVHLSSLHYGFLLPIGLLLLFNIVLFAIVFSSLTCRKHKIRSSAQKRTSSQDFLLAITLILMMGLTWIFGFLMLVADDVTYQSIMAWLFTVVNSLQGFFIFLSNCIRNPNVRSLWLHPILSKLGCGRRETTSSTATSSKSGSAETGQTRTRGNKRSEEGQSIM